MNNLEEIKQKLMVKPTVQERERVAVVIKGENPTKIGYKKAEKREEIEEAEEAEGEKKQGIKKQVRFEERGKPSIPLIVDETKRGFDREALLKKMAESKMLKVTTKKQVEIAEEKQSVAPIIPQEPIKKAKKITPMLLIESDEEREKEKETEKTIANEPVQLEEEPTKGEDSGEEFIMKPKSEGVKEQDIVPVKAPEPKKRKTQKVEKGIATIGPETIVEIGDTDLTRRLPHRAPPINIKVSSYYMNNREIFVNFINSLFEPYRQELLNNKDEISCDSIGQSNSNFSLLTHQKIVRDYLNLYTPYRGLLLYHGLGSGKTCTSISIAEGMKESKQVVILTPASLRANYIEELKKCGDLIYKRNQFWEWISTTNNPELSKTLSAVLNLPLEYIRKQGGAFFINSRKKSNYENLSDSDKRVLEGQINEMIKQKYTFVNYNGLRQSRLSEMTSNYTKNIFDNKVVVIDEAHNLISRIVNKLKKLKTKKEDEKYIKPSEDETKNIFEQMGESTPTNLALRLYHMLLGAKNARIVLLSGTPVINYPNEFAILFNILRGYIKTWQFTLNVKTTNKVDATVLQQMLLGEKSLDYLDYSPSSKILTITRNPFGFKNKIKKESGYQGVSNVKKLESGETTIDSEFTSDDDFERKIINILRRNDIDVIPEGTKVTNMKCLPDNLDIFSNNYIDDSTKKLKNMDSLKRRILGLSSYFRSAQENLLPKYNKQLGVDYHIVRIPMSDYQFKIYESARVEERKLESGTRKKRSDDEESSSTYRIFSRLFCNFVMPERPMPKEFLKKNVPKEGEPNVSQDLVSFLESARKEELGQDVSDEREGEIEGDEVVDKLAGSDYKQSLENALINIKNNSNDFLTPEALQTYSPKFLHILENIQDPDHQGLHLVYSQFRTAEGIGLLSLVLEKNGCTQFKIKKNMSGNWELDIAEENKGKPTFALYTGTETVEEKEIIRHIYNGEWKDVPESIAVQLKTIARNNNMGEIIKVFMITSSGSEGINLRNTRYVHIVDPYWHPVRLEQVIGRARRICSHKDLPKQLQTVEVFVYLMVFSPEQLKSDEAIELKRKDLSKAVPKVPFTSDQYLYEISEIKANLTAQLTDAIKESSFDCYIYSNGKCVNFGDPTNDKFAYVPEYSKQQNDPTVLANKKAIEWVGKPITINGVNYVYRRIDKKTLFIYDRDSYEAALNDPSIVPLQIGSLETNEKGEQVFKQLVV